MPQPERHGLAWSAEEEKQLYDAFAAGAPYEKCAAAHQRTAGGIVSCLKKLGVLDEDGNIITPRPPFAPSGAAQKRALRKEQKEAVRKKWAASALTPENPAPELNDKFREALRLMEDTDKNIFITGKAGTGKSTLLSWFCRVSRKAPVILAPTGVAALNVKGQTIHNFFNFYVDVTPEKIRRKKNKPRNAKLYQKLRCLVIDEISMVRADLMDCIDAFLRRYGPDPAREFGGVQMILIGDLYQLPPVVTSAERELFSSHYDSPYFFSAHALKNHALAQIELEKIYRQKDREFVALLNKIRNNSADENDLAHLNSRLGTSPLPAPAAQKGFSITLTTTNALADQVNETHLAALKGEMHVSEAGIEGDFGREYYPTAVELRYKAGAQIMMLNNDSEKRWVNGSLGAIERRQALSRRPPRRTNRHGRSLSPRLGSLSLRRRGQRNRLRARGPLHAIPLPPRLGGHHPQKPGQNLPARDHRCRARGLRSRANVCRPQPLHFVRGRDAQNPDPRARHPDRSAHFRISRRGHGPDHRRK